MDPKEYLKNKKVLVMGLGLLGGGIAATKWLVKHGAKVTVTDLKDKKALAGSIKALGPAGKKIRFVLGRHDEQDFKNHDIIVVNPAVPKESKFLKIALDSGAKLENEGTLFFEFCRNPIIAVTGTRGKTTTVNWILHFLKQSAGWRTKAILTGNSPEHPLLKELDQLDGKTPIVIEISSWHLEFFNRTIKPPQVAVITNIYPDHLNRHEGLAQYAGAKANIFKNQTKNEFLILNKKNAWTKFFLKQKPKSKVLYSDDLEKYCSERLHGDDRVNKQRELLVGARNNIFLMDKEFAKKYGEHNLQNLKTAALAANLVGVDWKLITKAVKTLPLMKFRQEIIYQKNRLTIVNDTTATSPDATVAALTRFTNQVHQGLTLILVTGGTDKNLCFNNWAKAVKKFVKKENLFLLGGSATKKMIESLNKLKYFGTSKPLVFDVFNVLLTESLKHAKILKPETVLLFSPSAASFEKFKNEFDRGEKFNNFFRGGHHAQRSTSSF